MITSSDGNIGFKLYNKEGDLLGNKFSFVSQEGNYGIKVVPFIKDKNIYGRHNGRINVNFTYK
ncbi:hypothetical protein [Photobacterium damselae]